MIAVGTSQGLKIRPLLLATKSWPSCAAGVSTAHVMTLAGGLQPSA